MNIIFDLDGTLIDSKMRLYRLFQHLAPKSQLSFEDYWALKKNHQSHEQILATIFGSSSNDIENFLGQWMELIESPAFLSFDKSFPGIDATLVRLGQHYTLHLCTARQFLDTTLTQLGELKLLPYFNQVLVTGQKLTKVILIKQQIHNLSSNDWIIGDTGKDIQAGQSLGLSTCAVLSGFMSDSALRKYHPDLILNSVNEFQPNY